MISTFLRPVWLGYSQTGGNANLRIDEVGGRLLLLGGRANEAAALLSYASREAGYRPLILDVDGYLSSQVSGYFPSYTLWDVLYDLYRMDESRARAHGELLSSAYTAALDLTFEEEAILDAAMQQLAAQDNMASPPVVYDALSGVEGFRGFYVDKLKGRIGTLKSLQVADSVPLAKVLSEPAGAIVDLSKSLTPRGTEMGAALLLAKLIAVSGSISPENRPTFVLMNQAHRIFKAYQRMQHGNRLLTAMLDAPVTSIFSSEERQTLAPQLIEACPTRILSADAWIQQEMDKRRWNNTTSRSSRGDRPQPAPPAILPNSYVLQHGYYGTVQAFVARPFEPKTSAARAEANSPPNGQAEEVEPVNPATANGSDPALVKRILQEVKAFDSSSMQSLVSYLSAEYPKDAIQNAIDDLERGGFLKVQPKTQKSGRMMLSMALTPQGVELLGRLA